jgi:hypothetical protein
VSTGLSQHYEGRDDRFTALRGLNDGDNPATPVSNRFPHPGQGLETKQPFPTRRQYSFAPAFRGRLEVRSPRLGGAGLPPGSLGEHGLAVRTESLAFTDGFLDELYGPGDPLAVSSRPPPYLLPGTDPAAVGWTDDYSPEFRELLPDLAGYVHYADGEIPGSPGGFYVVDARHRYDAHVPGRVPRGLPVESLDALGASSRIEYDAHDLLPVKAVDAVGLETAAAHDYRVLRPRQLTDPNGNTSSVTFSPAGLVTAQYVRGKDGEGDRDAPSVRLTYDLLAFPDRGQPTSVLSTRRVHHDTATDVPASERDDVIVSVQFSDGAYRTGDYWLIPARTATAEIEWPPYATPNTDPIAQPPRGIRHPSPAAYVRPPRHRQPGPRPFPCAMRRSEPPTPRDCSVPVRASGSRG